MNIDTRICASLSSGRPAFRASIGVPENDQFELWSVQSPHDRGLLEPGDCLL